MIHHHKLSFLAHFALYYFWQDQYGKVPLYWGITADGYVAFADDAELLKGACGKSLASFPQGGLTSISCVYYITIPNSAYSDSDRII